MASSNSKYRIIATQLGMGPSTVLNTVCEVPRAISEEFHDIFHLPPTQSELAPIKRGFQQIVGLPNCVGAMDGSYIPWTRCTIS